MPTPTTATATSPELPTTRARSSETPFRLSTRALATPEPLVRAFTRRVQQEGALDLTQGDYKNADFAPHPEVVRAAQRITRNTVHSYGPAVGRIDVRGEIVEFINRDGILDYPSSDVRFMPDEVVFTPGTRSGLAMLLEVLGPDGSGVVVPRPSWEYDWFVERAGKHVVELPTEPPEFLPDPEAFERRLQTGEVSALILNNPHNPTGRVFPKALVEELVRIAVEHRVFVLYDSVYQRLDYQGSFVNPAFAHPEWRDWVVTMSGLSKMDMFGASTGARACWVVLSDRIRVDGVRARDIVGNLSAWLVATPSTLAQDWALAALQSPLAELRRPSPYMRARRDFMLDAADGLAHLGVERTDYGGTFYAPLAFPGLVGEPFDRRRNGVRERAVVRDSVDAFELLLEGGVGGIPFAAFAGSESPRYGTWQRLSYGSRDVAELTVFIDRVRDRLERKGREGTGLGGRMPPAAGARDSRDDAVWESACTIDAYPALDGLDPSRFAAERADLLRRRPAERFRVTGTKHPDSTVHRMEQVARALASVPDDAPERADAALTHIEWHALVDAHAEFDESIADLLGSCNEVLLDFEGRQVSPEWLDLPEKVVLALLRHGVVPGEDRHLLFRVPNPWLEADEEKISRILAAVARANLLFLLACERLGIEPTQNAIHELTVPQINASAELGAVVKIGSLYLEALDGLFAGDPERTDAFLSARIPPERRGELVARASRVRLVPLVENVGALANLPELLEALYRAFERNHGAPGLPTPGSFATRFDGSDPVVRVFLAMSDTAEQSGKIATDAAYALAVASRDRAEQLLAPRAAAVGEPAPRVTILVGAGRAGFRGGLDPTHPGVIGQFARADGVTIQGIRADDPAAAADLATRLRAAVADQGRRGAAMATPDREALRALLDTGVRAHTDALLRIAPLVAPFGALVPQTRVRIRATGSVNYGRSIPEYPEEWGGGTELPGDRDLRDAWPEGVTLPRAITYNLACASLGLPAVASDLGVVDKRAAVLLDRHVPGYREIIASELPGFVQESVALVFGREFAATTARRCQRAAANLWVDAAVRDDLVAPTCTFAMLYLRFLAEDADSWDQTKEHESPTTREEELLRQTGRSEFVALCGERPGSRWTLLQTMVDAEEASKLLLARELTIEEKREFVDLRIEGWLRSLEDPLARELRAAWSPLRELGTAELTLRGIEQLVALEQLRGSLGA